MPRRRSLQSRQWVAQPLPKVWELFSNPATLQKITPPAYGASVELQSPEMGEGATVVISLKPYGVPVPLKWISKIQDFKVTPERCEFVDIQVSGPFAYWKHHHVFESGDTRFEGKHSGHPVKIESGGTWIVDDVEYEMPFGIFGAVAEKLFARQQLESMFAFRKAKILELLGPA
ncbi:MAG: SRPBCC family protein [Bdellovibrionota bacterium]